MDFHLKEEVSRFLDKALKLISLQWLLPHLKDKTDLTTKVYTTSMQM
jgi:hypothetical protein